MYNANFTYHPRLYSALSRLASFYNYGNTKFNILELADAGFYNKSDMFQDLVYFEHSGLPLPTAEEENVKDASELRANLLPYCRLERNLPFPNVSLDLALASFHTQKVSEAEIVSHQISNPYTLFADKNSKISVWSCEVMVYKMFEFDYSREYEISNK